MPTNVNNDQHGKIYPWCNGGIYILEAINSHLIGLKAPINRREFMSNLVSLASYPWLMRLWTFEKKKCMMPST